MGATFFFIMIALKIPIIMLGYIVWHAIRAVPDPPVVPDEDGGIKRPLHPHPHRRPRRTPPRPTRRGPHGGSAVPSPARTRVVVAKARRAPRRAA